MPLDLRKLSVTRGGLGSASRPTLRVLFLLLVVFALGVVGYLIVGGEGTSLLDAAYMTVITLTTVGYEESIELTGNPAGRIFTMALLVLGVGTFLYFFSNVTALLVEGTLDHMFWRARMLRKTRQLSEHTIVCGGGDTGKHVIKELLDTGRSFVLIERSTDRIQELYGQLGQEFLALPGDATEDEALQKAGIETASGVIACISNDRDNLVVTFSARHLNPSVRIVTRCVELTDQAKLRRAGADAVVSPDLVGGMRLVSELVRPTVVSFLDLMLREEHKGLRVEQVTVAPNAALADTNVGALRHRKIAGLLVVAVRTVTGTWCYNPDDDMTLMPGVAVVYMGTPATVEAMEDLAQSA